jgi:hypothetical protein
MEVSLIARHAGRCMTQCGSRIANHRSASSAAMHPVPAAVTA